MLTSCKKHYYSEQTDHGQTKTERYDAGALRGALEKCARAWRGGEGTRGGDAAAATEVGNGEGWGGECSDQWRRELGCLTPHTAERAGQRTSSPCTLLPADDECGVPSAIHPTDITYKKNFTEL